MYCILYQSFGYDANSIEIYMQVRLKCNHAKDGHVVSLGDGQTNTCRSVKCVYYDYFKIT